MGFSIFIWLLTLVLGATLMLGVPARGWAAPGGEEASSPKADPAMASPLPLLPTPKPDASTIPSETVSRFVTAYLAVVKLIESRELSLQRAETETESQQMQQELQAEAVELIQTSGLSLAAYWELLGLANSDPEFRERVLAQVEEASL
ncbi:MAG: DUF4168 domain-containing protein [Nodosilinea sp.]